MSTTLLVITTISSVMGMISSLFMHFRHSDCASGCCHINLSEDTNKIENKNENLKSENNNTIK